MRSFIAALVVVASLCAIGCHEAAVNFRHIHENPYRDNMTINPYKLDKIVSWCQTATCDRAVYVTGDCILTDGTNPLGAEIDLLVDTHLCIYNQSGHELTIKFGSPAVFGESVYTIPADGCANLTVQPEARGGGCSTEIVCSGGHSNPDVKVGEDTEP